MRRLLIALLALGLALPLVQADDKEKKDKESPSSFKEMEKDFLSKVRSVETPAEQKELLAKASKEFMAYAEKNPKADDRIEALSYVLRMGQPEVKDASALLAKDLAKSPKIKSIVRILGTRTDEDSTKVLQAVIDTNPDKALQAQACQALVKSRDRTVKQIQQFKDNDTLRERAEQRMGKETVQKMIASGEKLEKEQKQYSKLLQDKYADYVVDLSIGKKAPEIVSEDLDGKKVKLSDLRGKVVVLDIWATWCPPCRAMIPHEKKLVERLEGKPFTLVSVSADAKKDTVVDFIKKTPMPWTHWWNGATGGIVEAWDVEYYPTIYVLDHKGVIRYKDVREKEMDEAVDTLLKEMDKDKKETKSETK